MLPDGKRRKKQASIESVSAINGAAKQTAINATEPNVIEPLRLSVIGSGLGVSQTIDSGKLSNDKAVDSLFYESHDGASNHSQKMSNKRLRVIEDDSCAAGQTNNQADEVSIEQLQNWKVCGVCPKSDVLNHKCVGPSDTKSD